VALIPSVRLMLAAPISRLPWCMVDVPGLSRAVGPCFHPGNTPMKNISTGFGLCVAATAALSYPFVSSLAPSANASAVTAAHHIAGTAFAQDSSGVRRIVSANVIMNGNYFIAWRMWSDNAIDVRLIGERSQFACGIIGSGGYYVPTIRTADEIGSGPCGYSYVWRTLDNGTTGFRSLTDVDMSGKVDGGDLGKVLSDWGTLQNDFPPPPIDCNINSPNP
jgi:hypothetical protein